MINQNTPEDYGQYAYGQQALWQWRYNVFSLSHDLDVIMSQKPGLLVSFESNPVDVPACQTR